MYIAFVCLLYDLLENSCWTFLWQKFKGKQVKLEPWHTFWWICFCIFFLR